MDEQYERPASFWLAMQETQYEVRWVNAAGIKTRTLTAGKEHGQALLMLPGTSGHVESYVYNVAAHSRHFRTYAIDPIGHGWSDHPAVSYEIDTYVKHILNFMDAEGIERAHLTGQSLGGWVVARLAALHPDRVDRLVLNTPGGHALDPNDMKQLRNLGQAAVATDDRLGAVRARLEWLVHDLAAITDEMVAARYAIYSRPGYGKTMERVLCLQTPEIRERNLLRDDELASIKAETLVIWTDHNPSGKVEIGKHMADMIPNSRFELMTDCGHWPQVERPDAFNKLHIDFLTEK